MDECIMILTNTLMISLQLPAGGVDLTLSELQEMAARQQEQIQQQQHALVAKEQRLKFLKQQERRHQQLAGENERVRRLRERVALQEAKLGRLRAMQTQAGQHQTQATSLSECAPWIFFNLWTEPQVDGHLQTLIALLRLRILCIFFCQSDSELNNYGSICHF